MPVLKAIAPALLLIALLTPVITGYLRKKERVSILLGWGLFVFACLCFDILVPMLALNLYGHEGVNQVAPETPSTVAGVVAGWIYPCLFHYVGVVVRKGVDFLRGLRARKLP